MNDAPIACTLSTAALEARVSDIATLNRESLRSHERSDLTLDLTYAPEALAKVRDMVKREQECCAFLDFQVIENAEAIRVRIVAPEEARIAATSLFEAFVAGAAASSCGGCC